jgi:mannose-6-phosphate isomerase-like protein (cupin superfamily)
LVADKQHASDLSGLLAQLRSRGDLHQAANVVHRSWGSYHLIHESPGFKIRSLQIHAGASLSLQTHAHRSEHWVVISGLAHIATGDQDIVMTPNRSAYIAAGQKHRLYNPGQMPCTLIEIQSGSYLGEDDVVRFEEQLMA